MNRKVELAKERPKPGDRGTALTGMYPSGKVLIDGVEYAARMQSRHAHKGDEIEVLDFESFGLIVGKPDDDDK